MTASNTAKFTQGKISRHLIVMSGSATVGLVTLFLVDLVDMFYLSLLGETELAAAIGFAGSILFFTSSISIGFSIASGAQVSKAIGSNDQQRAKSLVVNTSVTSLLVAIPTLTLLMIYASDILTLIGAEGRAHELALDYLYITLPSFPLLMLGMAASGVVRALGEAKTAMNLTLLGGLVNFVLDPIFIFVLDMGVSGAATATVFARFAMAAYGIHHVVYKNELISRFNVDRYKQDFKDIIGIAFPAVLTNISTPITMSFITREMSQFGDEAVAGNAIISRVVPVAFAGLFALSGVVGPIAGQNWGAGQINRVRKTLYESTLITTVYVALVSVVLFLLTDYLIIFFSAEGVSAELVTLFCLGISLSWVFHGITFNTNALFNNLGKPTWATAFNLGKATLGTIPFVWVGANLYEYEGVLIGQAIGACVFGIAGFLVSLILIRKL